MTEPSRRPSSGFGLRRLWWLVVLKLLIVAFALYVALRAYNLI
ncbi:hypothetical protein [Alsobacter soli]|nr:hypothetical protein [Alsobacter soli]